jgi:PAS domain S-box-containing protein
LVEKFKTQDAKGSQKAANDLERFSSALGMSSDGVIVGDLYGFITDVNDTIIKMFGATDKSEFVGKHVLNFTVKSDKERAVNESLNMIISDQGRKGEYRALTKNGEEVPVEVTTAFIRDENGEKIGFVDIIRNLPLGKKIK